MRTAVVTLNIGSRGNELAALTHKSIRAYATKIGAEFIEITTRRFPESVRLFYEKLQIRELLHVYDRIIYLDSDVLVSPACPNLFEIVPYEMFGAFSEGKIQDRQRYLDHGKEIFGIDATEWGNNYFNAGVFVCDNTHRYLFTEPKVFWNDDLGEQTWLNTQVYLLAHSYWLFDIPVFVDLGYKYNHMDMIDWGNRDKSFIVHYAGAGKRDLLGDVTRLKLVG
jgi:alpha-N-acetylglucosamine transferase